jgi:type 1 fimbriae regulatory protein FimB/type 1 fimbriae regulatory protein FimE
MRRTIQTSTANFKKTQIKSQPPHWEALRMAVNTNLTLVVPTTEEQTVAPDMARRRPNSELRSREHLTLDEVERLVAAAKDGRHGHRDATMLLVAYRHGLRASELTDLLWDQIDFSTANLHVRRAKKGTPATHPILGDELRALRRLQREQAPKSPFVFTSERGGPFTTAGFARIVAGCDPASEPGDQGSPSHASARLRFQACQRWPRHPRAAGLPGP